MSAETNLLCCKCCEDGSAENLAKCYAIGRATLEVHCKQLGLNDMIDRINNQWAANRKSG